jgi:hypothetical protein
MRDNASRSAYDPESQHQVCRHQRPHDIGLSIGFLRLYSYLSREHPDNAQCQIRLEQEITNGACGRSGPL